MFSIARVNDDGARFIRRGGEQVPGRGRCRRRPSRQMRTDPDHFTPKRPKARVEVREAGACTLVHARIGASSCAGNRPGDPSERRNVVPEVRVRIVSVDAENVGDREHTPLPVGGRVLELRHEGVVADAVLNHDAAVETASPLLDSGSKRWGSALGSDEDRGHVHVRAADLLGDVAVEVSAATTARPEPEDAFVPPQPARSKTPGQKR